MQTEDDQELRTFVSKELETVSKGKSVATEKPKRKHYRHKDLPLFNREQVNSALRAYDRRPFLDLLTTWIEMGPDPEAIQDFADAHPDRWANALATIGKLGGFTEKKEIEVDFNLNIRSMSDSQLEDKLAEIKREIIELEATEINDPQGHSDSSEGSSST
jgi:hypothetical protein